MFLRIKKNWKLIILLIVVAILLIVLPFIIEKVIVDEKIQMFNISTSFSAEVWFGFVGSYLGTIGALILGGIAVYQNKRYKELADESEEKLINLQTEIKDLNERTFELIEINTRIEKAKYYPQLSDRCYSFWNQKSDMVEMEKPFQVTTEFEDYSNNQVPNEIYNNSYTFTYVFKNEGEKAIRNFNCNEVKIGSEQRDGIWIFKPCDIEPGKDFNIVYATKYNLYEMILEKVKKGEIEVLEFGYIMENVISERFSFSVRFTFYDAEEDRLFFNFEATEVVKVE